MYPPARTFASPQKETPHPIRQSLLPSAPGRHHSPCKWNPASCGLASLTSRNIFRAVCIVAQASTTFLLRPNSTPLRGQPTLCPLFRGRTRGRGCEGCCCDHGVHLYLLEFPFPVLWGALLPMTRFNIVHGPHVSMLPSVSLLLAGPQASGLGPTLIQCDLA